MFGSSFGSAPLNARCVRCDGVGSISPPCVSCGGSLLASANCSTCHGRMFNFRSCPVCRGTGRDPALEANSHFGTDRLSQGSAYAGDRRPPRPSLLASLFESRLQRSEEGRGRGGEQRSLTLSYRPRADDGSTQQYGDSRSGSGYCGTGGLFKCNTCEDSGKVVRTCSKCDGEGKVGRSMCSTCHGIGDEHVECKACR